MGDFIEGGGPHKFGYPPRPPGCAGVTLFTLIISTLIIGGILLLLV